MKPMQFRTFGFRKSVVAIGVLLLATNLASAQTGGVSLLNSWTETEQVCWWEGGVYDYSYYDDEGNEIVVLTPFHEVCTTYYHDYETVEVWAYGLNPECDYTISTDGDIQFTTFGQSYASRTKTYCLDYEWPPTSVYISEDFCPPTCTLSYQPPPEETPYWGYTAFVGASISEHSQSGSTQPLGWTNVRFSYSTTANCSENSGFKVDLAAKVEVREYWYGSNVYGFNQKTADVDKVKEGEKEHYDDAYACYQSMATFVNTHQNEYCYSENDSLQKADQFYQILVGYHDICKNHAALLDATTHPAIAAQIMSNGGY